MADFIPRPATPQAMVHRLPDKPDTVPETTKPTKFLILIIASTAVAGKVQIARSVSTALSCPLFQGDSLHETATKAASVGAATRLPADVGDEQPPPASGANETRYQRMWLSKMTRTGLLFPDESRPAVGGFSGFGGASSTSTSRRGSASSVASESSVDVAGVSSSASSIGSSGGIMSSGAPKYVNKPPVATQSEDERLRKANPALVVVTHPKLEGWHKDCIRRAVGDYSIGVIFVPLDEKVADEEDEEEELPVLQALDPRTMKSFDSLSMGNLGSARKAVRPAWDKEVVLKVDVQAKVEELAEEIVDGVKDIMDA